MDIILCTFDDRIMVNSLDGKLHSSGDRNICAYIIYIRNKRFARKGLEFDIQNEQVFCHYYMSFNDNYVSAELDNANYISEYSLDELSDIVNVKEYLDTAELTTGEFLPEPYNTTLMTIIANLTKRAIAINLLSEQFHPLTPLTLTKRAN